MVVDLKKALFEDAPQSKMKEVRLFLPEKPLEQHLGVFFSQRILRRNRPEYLFL